uniref:Putative secreted protein n=1 Tax=Ixodes ricinus TaxID=34613 RepID=A0A6B0TWN6_IXORI
MEAEESLGPPAWLVLTAALISSAFCASRSISWKLALTFCAPKPLPGLRCGLRPDDRDGAGVVAGAAAPLNDGVTCTGSVGA